MFEDNIHPYHAVLMSYILAESGWSWSLWITSCIPWFSGSMCCRWWYLDVLSYRHGSACWGQCRSLFFQVSLILHYQLSTAWLHHLFLTISVFYTYRYGSYPVRGKYRHEMALRILLACIEVRVSCIHIVIMTIHLFILLGLLAVTCDPPQALYSSRHISAHGFLH